MRSHSFLAPFRREANGFVLRSYQSGDGVALADALNVSYEHLRRFMIWARPHEDPIECELRVRQFHARYLLQEDFIIGIFDLSETRVLGGTGFHLREGPLDGGRCEMGMWIRADEAGRGLGRRVLAALISWAWDEWPFHRLSWHCSVENVASRKVAEACGLALEGRLRKAITIPGSDDHDLFLYATIRPPEFESRSPRSCCA
jgi:RimJ/RimL family protein N-acetyltransferase